MRKLIWTVAGLSLSAVIVLGTRVPVEAEAPQGSAVAPTAPLGRPAPMPAPMPPPPKPSEYAIKAKDGNFFICAAYYSGEHAGYLAEQVVRQLRTKNINSFVYNYADRERRELEWAYHQRMKNNPNVPYRPRFTRVEQQVAVLIGGFKTMEDASKSLPTVRQLPAPKVTFPSGEEAADRVMIYGDGHRTAPDPSRPRRRVNPTAFSQSGEEAEEEETHPLKGAVVNPFAMCFVVRNPAQAKQQEQDENYVDPAWKKMNVNESYSLLKCKKNFTLVVKVFKGPQCYQSASNPQKKDSGFLGKLGRADQGDVLEATAMQAHALAKFLREYKFEAYVLHTRYCSVVTVGGFAAQGDREMMAKKEELAKLHGKTVQTSGGVLCVDPAVDPLGLLPDPMPMRVPHL